MTTVGSATSADDEKADKPVVAPVNGGSPMHYLQACSKLDMEPNPFEQSFAGTRAEKSGTGIGSAEGGSETPKPVLPSIASMSERLAPGTEQFGWDAQSLRMGPLSPSMLEGPKNPIVFDDPTTQNPLPLGSFPTSTASIPNIFTSGAPLADNALPFVGVPGSLPAPPPIAVQTATPYPPAVYNPSHPLTQQQQNQSRPPQQYAQPNAQPPMNDRYMPPQVPQHPDNMNGYGNLHLLSQAQATHREMWIKRESVDANGNIPHSQSHPSQSNPSNVYQGGPPNNGQNITGVPGMAAAPQLSKSNVEPVFARGVRRSRLTSEEQSDDSERSKQSTNGGETSTGAAKKKQNIGDDKMSEEEKRKNFLERNRQAALKCRQRKKQWLSNLQAKVEYLTTDNEHLQNQTAQLRDEIIHLKALLLAHKDCPVAQANGVFAEAIGIPGHGGMMGHARAPHPMQHQQQQQQAGMQQGRGGPSQPRGTLPPPTHHHVPMPGQRIMNQPMPPSGQVGVMAGAPGPGGRPMSMMQDITPNASPSQSQVNVRY
ncbi:hypothetical protein BGX28_008930 [Mortierella sp. GBA30]|nr:hypothetical protein BGX28_008930 [Mortierella sp. GBA30]